MKVLYKTVVSGDSCRYSMLATTQPCCERMWVAIKWDAVVFADEDFGPKTPKLQVRLYHNYDGMEADHHAIDFCPFCGQKVECVEDQRVRLVEKSWTEEVRRVGYEEVPEPPP